ncbi:hypothetical protein [Streptomyces sp. NPDC001068]|uniref:hypothetical protein n=1 Tax=Streptomyces sp. NPDC001068 TaxID=3364544 RepID=UPI00369E5910
MAPDDYAYAVLADGARPFRHRAGVRVLLGLPEDTGVRVSFAPPEQRRSFRYVHEHAADPTAPSGWDDLLGRPGAEYDAPAQTMGGDPVGPAGSADPLRAPRRARAATAAPSEATTTAAPLEVTAATAPPEAMRTAAAAASTAPEDAVATTARSRAPVGPVVTDLVIPGGSRPPAASGSRNQPGPVRQHPASAAAARTEESRPPTPAAPLLGPHRPPSPAPRHHLHAPQGPATASAPEVPEATEARAPSEQPEALAPAPDPRPRTPRAAPRPGARRTAAQPPTHGPRDEPPVPGRAVRAPSRALPDRRPVATTAPAQAAPRRNGDEDASGPWPESPRHRTEPPYRRTGTPSAAPPRPQPADPAPAVPAPPPAAATAAAPAPPQVLVVRAPAAPADEAAFWQRRHLGRLLNGVVR